MIRICLPRFAHFLCHYGAFGTTNSPQNQHQCGLRNFRETLLTIFAGPNGSGKTTIIKELTRSDSLGYYLNADDFEKTLKEKQYINFGDFYLRATQEMWQRFLEDSTLSQKSTMEGYPIQISIRNNVAVASAAISSYEAALLVDFIRNLLIVKKATLSFETVMSHPSKKRILQFAIENGYICNLHFITIASPIINIARVKDRVAKGGHPVPPDKIKSRYYKSLELLSEIIPLTKQTVLYDNSGKNYRIFASVHAGSSVTFYDNAPLPNWYNQYVGSKLNLQQI